ncbi:DUF362 domain-containing protein [Thermosulfurimonas marina]|uniref:DUF362 domain-containing protein n=1 Tax=Thermosulfurimonas marina TaxID=2047767 RepID=UPI00144AEF57|nr:DUF362 domain-containing protein [Thermosulfurimonas marina]
MLAPEKVLVLPCEDYTEESLRRAVEVALEQFLPGDLSGARVLVKPNLVAPRQASLSCTHPATVRAVCEGLLARGAEVRVGDSPAFGTTRSVARAAGLLAALKGLPVRLVSFRKKVRVALSCGLTVGLAREALCADLLVNLPRLKAHNQLLLTAAVKNLFGCVVGLEKPLLHARLGERGDLFFRMILEVAELLPVGLNLLDAVVAMEGQGPTGGRPRKLGYLFASGHPLALDTVLYQALGLSPEKVPLWKTALDLRLFGARPEEAVVEGDLPDLSDFQLPLRLSPVTFHPLRLLRGMLRRLLLRLRSGFLGIKEFS